MIASIRNKFWELKFALPFLASNLVPGVYLRIFSSVVGTITHQFLVSMQLTIISLLLLIFRVFVLFTHTQGTFHYGRIVLATIYTDLQITTRETALDPEKQKFQQCQKV